MVAEVAIGRKTQLRRSGGGFGKAESETFIPGLSGVCRADDHLSLLLCDRRLGGKISQRLCQRPGLAAAQDGFFEGFIGKPLNPFLFLAVYGHYRTDRFFRRAEWGGKGQQNYDARTGCFGAGRGGLLRNQAGCAGWGEVLSDSRFQPVFPMTVLAAMGQLFYSMSLAMGIMVTYGSYMKKGRRSEKSVKQIELFDTGMALWPG